MEQHMLQINNQIKQEDSRDYFEPIREKKNIQDSPATLLNHQGHTGGENRQEEAYRCGVEQNQEKIGDPAPWFTVRQLPTGGYEFPNGDDQKRANKKSKSDSVLFLHRFLSLSGYTFVKLNVSLYCL